MAHGLARVAKELNASTVNQAQKYVFGFNDGQLRFVERRLRRVDAPPVQLGAESPPEAATQ